MQCSLLLLIQGLRMVCLESAEVFSRRKEPGKRKESKSEDMFKQEGKKQFCGRVPLYLYIHIQSSRSWRRWMATEDMTLTIVQDKVLTFGGLDENGPHRVIDLNAWSPGSGTV